MARGAEAGGPQRRVARTDIHSISVRSTNGHWQSASLQRGHRQAQVVGRPPSVADPPPVWAWLTWGVASAVAQPASGTRHDGTGGADQLVEQSNAAAQGARPLLVFSSFCMLVICESNQQHCIVTCENYCGLQCVIALICEVDSNVLL